MLWWRKRNEGFEWRDYVRTTILVRREQRRQRIKDVQAAAAAHVKDAGRRGLDAGIAGARNAGTGLGSGARGAWSALKRGSAALGAGSVRAAQAVCSGSVVAGRAALAGLSAAGQRVGAPLEPVLEPFLSRVREPQPNLVLKVVAVLTGLGAVYRTLIFGFDGDAIAAALISVLTGGILALAALTDPYRGRGTSGEGLLGKLRAYEFALPGERRLPAVLAVGGVVAIFAIGSALYHYSPSVTVASVMPERVETGALPATDGAKIEGRATALAGDMLRIGRTSVALDGIEAPEAAQVCRRKSGTWRCGAAAKDALAKLVRGRRVSCDVLGDDGVVKRARCYAGETDVAEALVRSGHAFASGGFWSAYASVESEAQTQMVGLWAGGEAERPQDYRDRRWEEAKKEAPEGCPIKGSIRSGARHYVLPWAPRYDSIRLRTSRGERWFCSEDEARAAGWSPGSSS